MWKTVTAAVAIMAVAGSAAGAQTQDSKAQAKPAVQAFEHYEAVRVALSSDKLGDVAPHAKQLAAQTPALGGDRAKKAVDQIIAAKTLEDARTHFGELSELLIPLFQAEGIPGTTVYMCSMKKKQWMQKGEQVENPYYGQAMLTCGSPVAATKK